MIIQGIREAERNMVYEEFVGKTQELITGMVTRTDPRSGALHVKDRLQSGEAPERCSPPKEQVPGRELPGGRPDQRSTWWRSAGAPRVPRC